MKWRLWRRIKVLPGVTINLTKKGASVSLGPRGAKVTLGSKGVRTTAGLPGTGLFATNYTRWGRQGGADKAEAAAAPDQRLPNWQFYFFQKLLNDRIGEWEHAWSQATGGSIEIPGFIQWAQDHVNRLLDLNYQLISQFEADSVEALGPSRSVGKIATLIDNVAAIVKKVIQWEQEVRVFAEDPVFGCVARTMTGMSWPCIEAIQTVKSQLDDQLITVAQTKRIFISFKMSEMPHISATEIAANEFHTKAFSASGQIRGDFLQKRFRISRGETPLGEFSRESVLENCKAALFKPSDIYLSQSQGEWRRLEELESGESIEFGG